jgi:outer membrane protein
MNSHIVKSMLAAVLVAGATSAASAQELKIGYVNSDRVLRDAAPAKAAQAKLEAEFSKREKDLNELASKLKAASDRLDKDAPTLGEAERTRRQRELVDQDRDLQRRRREFQEDLSQRKNEELATVVERTKPRHQADLRDREVRPHPAGSRLLEPEGRHHRQGDQGPQRPERGRQVGGAARWAKSGFATSSSGLAVN